MFDVCNTQKETPEILYSIHINDINDRNQVLIWKNVPFGEISLEIWHVLLPKSVQSLSKV